MAFFHASMALATAAFALFAAASLFGASLSFHPSQGLARLAFDSVPWLTVAAYCQWRGYARLRDGALAATWAGAVNFLSVIPVYAAARSAAPFRDGLFARVDARLGLQVPMVLGWLQSHGAARIFLAFSYDLLLPMVICAVLVTALAGPIRALKQYIVAVVVAIGLAVPVSWALPAVGPWATYGFRPSADQAAFALTLGKLRAPGPFVIDSSYGSGLITFPSFHVILAALSCIALWSVPKLRLPAALLCALIACSTVATGWHYVADGLAGIVVAALAHACARAFTVVESRRAVRQSP